MPSKICKSAGNLPVFRYFRPVTKSVLFTIFEFCIEVVTSLCQRLKTLRTTFFTILSNVSPTFVTKLQNFRTKIRGKRERRLAAAQKKRRQGRFVTLSPLRTLPELKQRRRLFVTLRTACRCPPEKTARPRWAYSWAYQSSSSYKSSPPDCCREQRPPRAV